VILDSTGMIMSYFNIYMVIMVHIRNIISQAHKNQIWIFMDIITCDGRFCQLDWIEKHITD
jgi:hypothetical protein